MASVPTPHRITPPHITTWATAELHLWWSPPQVGGRSAAAYNENLAARSRRIMLWTVMLSGFRTAEMTEVLSYLPPEIWNLVFGFAKHPAIPGVDTHMRTCRWCIFPRAPLVHMLALASVLYFITLVVVVFYIHMGALFWFV
jgi:hypothetical protein